MALHQSLQASKMIAKVTTITGHSVRHTQPHVLENLAMLHRKLFWSSPFWSPRYHTLTRSQML